MALERKDRVKETTTTTGTGTVNLGGAVTGFRTFVSCVTSGATVRYFIETADLTEWEVGEGIFTDATPDTLSRVTVYASSNAGSLVNFSAGDKIVALSLVASDITGGQSSLVSNETPTGTINGSNTTFTLANIPITGTLKVYLNGQRLTYTDDYTLATATITMVVAPMTGDILRVDYELATGSNTIGSTSFVTNETPSGTVNGSNTAFDTASNYVAGTIQVYRDGQLMKGGGADYTETDANTITFTTAPITGSVLLVSYQSVVSTSGNADTLDGQHASYFALMSELASGWHATSDSWSYASADAPTFTITVPSGAASIYSAGMRIKLTQTTVKYFIITAVADSVLTVYGGTDYTLVNAAISAISYSTQKAPLGFPLSPTKWTIEYSDVTQRTQGTPTSGTWYNINTATISIPIGCWNTSYSVGLNADRNDAGGFGVYATLSTANNSESDSEFTATHFAYMATLAFLVQFGSTVTRNKTLLLAAKTPYYLNTKVDTTTVDNIFNENAKSKLVIRAICAYL